MPKCQNVHEHVHVNVNVHVNENENVTCTKSEKVNVECLNVNCANVKMYMSKCTWKMQMYTCTGCCGEFDIFRYLSGLFFWAHVITSRTYFF